MYVSHECEWWLLSSLFANGSYMFSRYGVSLSESALVLYGYEAILDWFMFVETWFWACVPMLGLCTFD